MSFGEHLDVLRKMLFRVIGLTLVMAVGVFCMKDQVFAWLLAPHDSSFCTFQAIETVCRWIGADFQFEPFNVTIISTELSAQFMTHLSTSVYLGLLLASPYVVYELFAFIAPALYEREKRVARVAVVVVYVLFFLGVLMSYFVLFPISFRFLATYQVSGMIQNTITLDSYISTFTTLTFMMGLVFQLPVVTYFGGPIRNRLPFTTEALSPTCYHCHRSDCSLHHSARCIYPHTRGLTHVSTLRSEHLARKRYKLVQPVLRATRPRVGCSHCQIRQSPQSSTLFNK